jgi:tetratricopeptide (TPR) repeat protein
MRFLTNSLKSQIVKLMEYFTKSIFIGFFSLFYLTLSAQQDSTSIDSIPPALDSYYNYEEIDPFFKRTGLKEEDKLRMLYQQADNYYRRSDYKRARELCYAALRYQTDWGKPHYLVGLMYAASGKKCSPETDGLGFHAQVLIWAAIEEWQLAVDDPEVGAQAKAYIEQYSAYLPSKESYEKEVPEDQRGEFYFIPCWVQRWAKVQLLKE